MVLLGAPSAKWSLVFRLTGTDGGVGEWVIGGQMEKRGGEGRRVKQWRVVMQSGVGC